MPQSIAVGNNAFADYLKVASLPRDERQKTFGKLSNEEKASFVKVQFALQLVKRPNLNKEQRTFISEAISKTSAELYNRESPEKARLAGEISQEFENRALGLFPQKEAFEILAALYADKDADVALLQKYEQLLQSGMQMRKRLVSEMPMTERVTIWKTQLAFHLAASSLNKEQKEFIVEIMPNIQSIFEASSNLPKDEQNKYLENLESDMFSVFTKMEAFAIFMELGIQKIVNDAESTNIIRGDCNCCWYCSKDGETCNNADCRVVSFCGPFDTWDCTTRCHI